MRAEADAAAQRVQPAGALPDPVLRVELMNINNYGNDAGFNLLPSKVGETKYTLMQMLPAWGKRDLRRDVANADVQQATARTSAAWTELAMRIKTSYARYYLAAGNERLTREILDLMARVEQIAQARYAGGLVAQQDAIRAQLEQTGMRSELIMQDSEKRQVRARLNALLAREPPRRWPSRRRCGPCPRSAPWTLRRWRSGRVPTIRNCWPKTPACAAPRRTANSPAAIATRTSPWASRQARWDRASPPGG